jgi:predicted Zn-dependent peptidase
LADLYGASLHVGAEKLGDRQLLVASLEWPTAFVPRANRVLAEGLALVREVLSLPKRGRDGDALDADLVRTEQTNHVRSLRALRDDKARYALRRCIEVAFRGEPFGLDVDGTEEDVPLATPEALAALHRRLLATAPVEIFLVGDLRADEAAKAVREHLLWPGRAAKQAVPPAAGSARAARSRPVRRVEPDDVSQGKLVLAFRAAIPPTSPLQAAASTLAGVLGGGPFSRLFKVVREIDGLCYYAGSSWNRAKGAMIVQSGIEPGNEPRARKRILALEREVASGVLEPHALTGLREAAAHRVAALEDDRGALVSWLQDASALGTDPSPKRHLERLRAVTPADVRRVGRLLKLDTTFFLTSRAPAAVGAAEAAP